MKKKNTNNAIETKEVVSTEQIENVVSTPLADQINAGSVVIEPAKTKKLGRPANPDSARAKKLAEMEAKRIANGGVLPLGRPAVEGSARQLKLQAAAEKKASGAPVVLGRPKMSEEQKIAWRAAREAKRAAAIEAFKAGQSSVAALIENEVAE